MAYEEGEAKFPMPIPRKWIVRGIIGIIVIVVLVATFYSIGPEQVGVIKRWGEYV
ncbi:unnamed protein product, partial [marine sediment metagenome]